MSAQDSDSDSISDVVEDPTPSYASQDLVLDVSELSLAKISGRGGNLASTAVGVSGQIPAISFEDTTPGYGYYRLVNWTGDLTASKGNQLHFGIQVTDLGSAIGTYWATTSTADVRLVSNSGDRVSANLMHGGFEIYPLATQYGEIYQYSVPLTPESFECSDNLLTLVLQDLAYIEIRAEFWGWATGMESYLVPAGEYWASAPDTDGDGTFDYLDTDSDNDGLLDSTEGTADTDGDGLADYRDRDSDNDGILDSVEGGSDFDGDGLRNAIDPDSDGDGVSDLLEGESDADVDSSPNYLDTDSDNDGLSDGVEGLLDIDNDGLANYLDTDSDNDSIPDGSDPDADGDGITNHEEAFAEGQAVNLVVNGSFDDETYPTGSQYTETLSQLDDGVSLPLGGLDIAESPNDATTNFTDFADTDGGNLLVVWTGPTHGETVWSQDVSVEAGMGYVFSYELATIIPGLEPALDFRVNGASLGVPAVGGSIGVWTRYYAGYTAETTGTITLSIHNAKTTLQQTALGLDAIAFSPITTDSDGDGSANFLDRDSDGDTIEDGVEGTADPDSDGIPNFLDLDSDNDTILDIDDSEGDPDGDGIPGYADTDSDNDNVEDFREGSGDFDGDGIPDHLDSDSDNDGTPDAPGEDTDGDGIYNSEETLVADTDNDGTPDYLDLDSDGDGISDAVEFLNDVDADGVPDYRDYQPSFSCTGFAFQSYNGQTQLALVDVNAGVFVNLGGIEHGMKYNAIAYRASDDYIYGQDRGNNSEARFIRIGSDGSITRLGSVSGMPRTYVAGTFDDQDTYWTTGGGRLYGVDVDSLTVVANYPISPNPKGGEIDLAYNHITGVLYGSTSKGGFFSVDRASGAVVELGNNGKTFGALIADFTGTIYGFDNKGTGAFRVNQNDGSVTWVASSPKSGTNDGTICPDAILAIDTDGDGISDEYDLDDDNDGIYDQYEGCVHNPNGDEDGDGIRNWTDTIDDNGNGDGTSTDYVDTNGDGVPDVFDIDGDGTPNHLDLDADGDGMLDYNEASGDADGDGCDNFLDSDSDNDGIDDGTEGTGDEDGDGIEDYLDGFDDRDDDGDGVRNGHECDGDTDGDGFPNTLDLDSDDDGFTDAEEMGSDPDNPRDSDGDGIPNHCDFDDDGDGIPTVSDPCPLCNLDDNYIAFDISTVDIFATWDVRPGAYEFARDIWNEVKYELNCNTDGTPLEQYKRGFDEEDFYIAEDSEVIVTCIYDGGNHINSVAHYNAADPVGSWTTIWEKFAFGPTAPLVTGSTASLGIVPAGTELRLGLVENGGAGGTQKIYMDSYLNPSGLDFVAANISIPAAGDGLIVSFEDQTGAHRDNDFNDVILMLEVIPQSAGTGQFAGSVSGDSGVVSSDVTTLLSAEGLNQASSERVGQLMQMPASGNVSFELIGDNSDLAFTLGIYDASDVATLSPGSPAYREVATAVSVVVLDNRTSEVGDSVSFDPANYGLAGKEVGVVVIPHNIPENFLKNPHRYSPKGAGNDTKRQPLFSVNGANPGQKDQFLAFTNGTDRTLLAIEDLAREGNVGEVGADSDSDFSDIEIRITPAVDVVDSAFVGYYQGSPDPTVNWNGDDGWTGDANGDF
ncbi:MAG: hypothetical protein AAGC74_00860 [Verrucomicrobiota bacterium]